MQNRTVYQSWAEFDENEPTSLRIALTARDGRGRKAEDLQQTLLHLRQTSPVYQQSAQPVLHLILGPEDHGLNANDLIHAHWACLIPTFGMNTSLNLAQAGLLAMFIVRQCWGGERSARPVRSEDYQLLPEGSFFPDELFQG